MEEINKNENMSTLIKEGKEREGRGEAWGVVVARGRRKPRQGGVMHRETRYFTSFIGPFLHRHVLLRHGNDAVRCEASLFITGVTQRLSTYHSLLTGN